MKLHGVVFVPTTGTLYFSPSHANYVLIVDPTSNTSDATSIAGVGSASDKWFGGTTTNKKYFAPFNADNVLIVAPVDPMCTHQLLSHMHQ